MLLKSLVDYYHILAKEGLVPQPGYSVAKVSFVLLLSEQGVLQDIIDVRQSKESGKKPAPRMMRVPEQLKRSGKNPPPYFLCDKSDYVLGVSLNKSDKKIVCTRDRFEAFRNYNREQLEGIEDNEANAVRLFLESWNPEKAQEVMPLKDNIEEYANGSNFVFRVGNRKREVHDSDIIKQHWEKNSQGGSTDNDRQGVCLITGQKTDIERIHPAIKGIAGGQTMGSTLISFQKGDNAYESYGNKDNQGYNAHIGKSAAFAYGTALNYLLADQEHRVRMGDMTVVYWAKSEKSDYADLITALLNGTHKDTEKEEKVDTSFENRMGKWFHAIADGKQVREIEGLDENMRFYVMGISPNAARASVRMYYENTFGRIVEHLQMHYRDIALEPQYKDENRYINLWKLVYETAPSASKNKEVSPILAGSVMRAVITGANYPESLYEQILMRCRADKKINFVRASVIKGVLMRNHKKTVDKEVLQMALNEESNNKAYVLGRMFAVMEMVQREALKNDGAEKKKEISSTIKDRYYNSASTTPGYVFPILLKLSESHFAKLKRNEKKDKIGIHWRKEMERMFEKLDVECNPFPKRLSLEEQGVFTLGYYHQSIHNYKKKDKDECVK